jgi:hypothetical protein
MDGRDYELVAAQVSGLNATVSNLDATVSNLVQRVSEVEKVNARLEAAALTTARAMQEISRHWDAVYEAMRREEVRGEVDGLRREQYDSVD